MRQQSIRNTGSFASAGLEPEFDLEANIPLTAVTCALIGAKYNEPDENLPKIRDLKEAAKAHNLTWQAIVDLESRILKTLGWNMNVVTPLPFIRFMSYFGVVFESDEKDTREVSREVARSVTKYIAVFSDLVSYYPEVSIQFSDAEIALACVVCARRHYRINPDCNSLLFEVYGEGVNRENVTAATDLLWEKFSSMNKRRKPCNTLSADQQIK